MSEGSQNQVQTFRPSIRAVVISSCVAIALLLIFGVVGVAGFIVLGSHVFSWGFTAIAVIGIAAFVWTMRNAHHYFVALDSDGLTISTPAGDRRIPYQEVLDCRPDEDGVLIHTEQGIIRAEQICFASPKSVAECVDLIRSRSKRGPLKSADPRSDG